MRFVLVFAAVFFFGSMIRAEALVTPDKDCACRADDSRDVPVRFNFGPYKGMCVDSCRFRQSRRLSAKEAREFSAKPDEVIVTNILHEHRFWTARIPVEAISEVDVGFENFLAMISHVFLRFRFEATRPVTLISQDGKNVKRTITDLNFSVEGVPPRNHPYKFFESSRDQYLLAYRLLSTEDGYDWMIRKLGHSVKQYRLNLEPLARTKLLTSGLEAAETRTFSSVYHLFTNNCATGAVDLVENAAEASPQPASLFNFYRVERALPVDFPIGTFRFLNARGLTGAVNEIPNLEVEFAKSGRL